MSQTLCLVGTHIIPTSHHPFPPCKAEPPGLYALPKPLPGSKNLGVQPLPEPSFPMKTYTSLTKAVLPGTSGTNIPNSSRGNNLEDGDEGYHLFRGLYQQRPSLTLISEMYCRERGSLRHETLCLPTEGFE